MSCVQIQELRGKLAAAASDAARHEGQARECQQRCATLQEMRDSDAQMRASMAAERGQLSGMLAAAQQRAEAAHTAADELRQQVR